MTPATGSFLGALELRVRRFGVGVLSLLVLGILLAGVAALAGRAQIDGRWYRAAGLVMVLIAVGILGVSARHWAKWFFALCVIVAAKALFAVAFGYTLSQPRIVVDRLLATRTLALLIALAFLSYRSVLRAPRSKVEIFGLIAGVVGLLAGILTEPNVWPLLGAVVVMGLCRLWQPSGASHREEG